MHFSYTKPPAEEPEIIFGKSELLCILFVVVIDMHIHTYMHYVSTHTHKGTQHLDTIVGLTFTIFFFA